MNYINQHAETANKMLAGLTQVNICSEGSICDYLSNNPKLQAIVATDGHCYIVPSPHQRRMVQYLLNLVRQSAGTSQVMEVSPLAFDQWQKNHRLKTNNTAIKEHNAANQKLHYVFNQAIAAGASDVYLDIGLQQTRLSFRTFGYKQEIESYDRDLGLALARSMWAQAKTGQFEEGSPCDCSFTLSHNDREYRIRANSLPDVRGPSVVCRLRDPQFALPLDQCGYSAEQAKLIKRICAAPGGLILISGETNSGKSTTLGSLMQQLPKTQKIIEVADPVEIHIDHVTHVEINRYRKDAADIYNRIQAAIVRQNPDTLVLGEIRDAVTADAAMNMAIQGKRVYSTLHSQSCLAAIPRLENLGIHRELLGLREFLVGIVNQNLVPLLCPLCALEKHPDAELNRHYQTLFGAGIKHRNPQGCDHCQGGIAGQTLVAEVYPLSLDRSCTAHELIAQHNLIELERYMTQRFGIQSKHHHAAEKIRAGCIDPTETERILGEFYETDIAAPSHACHLADRNIQPPLIA